jgi:cobalt/nickel transport system permease protein
LKHAFLDHHSRVDSPIHRLDAKAKVIVFFAFILVGVSSRPTSFALFGLLAMGLVAMTLVARLPLAHMLKKVLIILPFLFFVALSIPFMKRDGGDSIAFWGFSVSRTGLWILWNVLVKASLGVFSIILLYSTTTFPKLIKAMEQLHLPKVFTVLFSFMYRYSFILVDEVQRMKRARDSRCFGGTWLWQGKTIGHMVGTLFVRSYHRGERVYLAMIARGYDGTMRVMTSERFGKKEGVFLIWVPFLLFLRILLG